MASTYVNNLRLEEIGSGEQSGTWGDTTNTNLETNRPSNRMGNQSHCKRLRTDNIHNCRRCVRRRQVPWVKTHRWRSSVYGTLLPNTSSKTWFMYNATSYDLDFTCGSGANVIFQQGQTLRLLQRMV